MVGEKNRFTLDIRVSMRAKDQFTGGNLELNEQIEIDDLGFLEMSSVLARFHELAMELKKKSKS